VSQPGSDQDEAAGPSDAALLEIEETALELARLAGAEVQSALGRTLAIRYKKSAEGAPAFRDPVSEVDHAVEALIRARLAERFPEHGIIGEEVDEEESRAHDFVWAIDPIDGTTNFINGFPLFAASIGILHQGRPLVGALWCSASHALRAGVYHARVGGRLRFEGEPLTLEANEAVRRRLAGEPWASSGEALPWDDRKTGSAAIECAFVAAGLLRVARFARPNIWDVAGGVALVRATGGAVRTKAPQGWVALERFKAEGDEQCGSALRRWRRPVILGEPEAVEILVRRYS
jgi:myo-inositol-1(or 4)-monophosphatase